MSFAGWAEILFIGILTFIIIGPKDLPKLLYTLGKFMQRLRALSSEFMAEFEAIRFLKEEEEKRFIKKQERKRK